LVRGGVGTRGSEEAEAVHRRHVFFKTPEPFCFFDQELGWLKDYRLTVNEKSV
jgi:hypothetical protein